jgi:hypothetical protein
MSIKVRRAGAVRDTVDAISGTARAGRVRFDMSNGTTAPYGGAMRDDG